nr:sterol uptake control protein 2 [Quercus suber]
MLSEIHSDAMQVQSENKVHRRSHKKSRNGCSQCKQRHLKCDEGRPSCLQCGIARQPCTYVRPTRPISPVTSGRVESATAHLESSMTCAMPASSHASSVHDVNSTRESPVEVNIGGHELRVSLHPSTDPGPSDFHVNYIHIKLFHHATTILLPQYGRHYESSHKYIMLVQDTSLDYPFLMNQLLAFSALHLSTADSSQKSMYEVQATGLQSSAIKLFNQSSFKYESASHVAAFVFSTLLARHVLCTVLVSTDNDSGRIIEGLAEFFRVQLGTRTIVGGAWESLLRHPDLTEFLSGFGDRRSTGQEACID